MDVDTTMVDPPVEQPDVNYELEQMHGARQRATCTLHRRVQTALDRGDFDAAEFFDEQLTMVNVT